MSAWRGHSPADRAAAARAVGRPASDAGFTLLEVIIAFVITAMMLGMAGQVFSAGFTSTERAARTAAAAALATSVLAATGIEEPLAPGITRGVFANGFGWERRVAVINDPAWIPPAGGRDNEAPPPVPYRVAVTILWEGGGSGVSLVTHRLGPAIPQERRR